MITLHAHRPARSANLIVDPFDSLPAFATSFAKATACQEGCGVASRTSLARGFLIFLALCCLLALPGAHAQTSIYYLTAGDQVENFAFQNGAVINSWSQPDIDNTEYPIAVADRIRTIGVSSGNLGSEYLLNGTFTGTTYTNPGPSGISYYDGASDGTFNYTVNYSNGNVYRCNSDWTSPVYLFGTAITSDLGITFDPSDNTLWILNYGNGIVRHYTLTGTLLGSFATGLTFAGSLARDPADGTFWLTSSNSPGTIYQYDSAGNQLDAVSDPAAANRNFLGGEFQIVCTPPPADLINWWPGDGNAQDIQSGHNGTLQGDTTFAPGKVGQAFSFDGNGDYVDVGDVDLPATFTIDAWINPSDVSGDRAILTKHDGSGVSYYFDSFPRQLLLLVKNTGGGLTQYQTNDEVVSAGSWQHVAVTYDGNAGAGEKIKFYVNGVPVGATVFFDDGGIPEDNALPARIGTLGDGTGAYSGLIDEVEIFTRVLSQPEIQSIYDAGGAGKCKPVIYVSNAGNATVEQFDASGNPSLFTNDSLNSPRGLAFDAAGNLYVASPGDNTIQKFDANGTATLFADSADGVSAPEGIAFDHEGNLFVVNNGNNTIQKIDPAGNGTLFANSGLNLPYGIARDPSGNFYVSNFGNNTIWKFPPAGGPIGFADGTDGLSGPLGLAFDRDGNLYAANYVSNTITKVDPAGNGTTFADGADGLSSPYGLVFDAAGNLYAINQSAPPATIVKIDPAGNGTLFANTGLNAPTFITIKPGPLPPPPPIPAQRKFLNISSRASVGTGENVAIGGFIIQGDPPVTARSVRGGAVASKRVLIRGLGPSLNITGDLDDPVLELHNGPTIVASNDNWGDAANEVDIQNTGLAPTNANEAAILITLNADVGYTAILSGAGGTSGIGLVEVYDLDSLGNTHLANISTRANVLTGDDRLIGGVILRGVQERQVLLRAIGPSLATQGVDNELADPHLELHDGNGALLQSNDDWGSSPDAAAITATGLAPTDPKESAILFTPDPGNYTAIVSGVGGGTGIGLVEAYRLGPPPP